MVRFLIENKSQLSVNLRIYKKVLPCFTFQCMAATILVERSLSRAAAAAMGLQSSISCIVRILLGSRGLGDILRCLPLRIRNEPCWRILPADVGRSVCLKVLHPGQIFLNAGRYVFPSGPKNILFGRRWSGISGVPPHSVN